MRLTARHALASVFVAALAASALAEGNLRAHIAELKKRMRDAAANLEFEEAARVRDEILRLEANELELPGQAASANVGVHLGKMQNSRVFRGVRTGSGGRGKQARRSGR